MSNTRPSILSLWWPLAASSVLMSAEIPFVNAGIARTLNPEIALAAFGLANSLAIVTEAPITMLNGATAALARDRPTFKRLERFTIYLGILATSFNFLLTFTPLYGVVLRQWMGVPGPVADACLPALRIFLLWPAPIGWRRFHQGLLIRLRRTKLISIGTVVRLCVTVTLTLLTVFVLRLPGQMAGALSVICAIISESLLITYWARKIWFGEAEVAPREPLIGFGQLLNFYLPLMMVSAISIVGQPLISTGMARAAFPTESLASWPIVWGLTGLIAGLCQPIQETTIAVVDGSDSLPRMRRFGLAIGLSAAALLMLVALTPLAGFYFGQLIGLPPGLRAFTDPAIVLMAGYPLWVAVEMMLRGFLIKRRRTPAVRLAMACNIVTLACALAAGIGLNLGSGVQVAAVAVNLAIGAEISVLAWQARPAVLEMRAVATAV